MASSRVLYDALVGFIPMSLPPTVRVKLSSEAAGAISITPVVVRDMPARELIEMMLPATGKDTDRVRDMLDAGSIVSGASRLRWVGIEASAAAVDEILATFPDPDPAIPFAPSRCMLAVLLGPYARIELARETASRRRFLSRSSFWDRLIEIARVAGARYYDYSYRDRADCFRVALDRHAISTLRHATRLLPYPALARQVESAALDHADLYVLRLG